MSIWNYSDSWVSPDDPSSNYWAPIELRSSQDGWTIPDCIYCRSPLTSIGGESIEIWQSLKPYVHVCATCGWWIVSDYVVHRHGVEGEAHLNRTWGQLCRLDLSDISAPIDEVQGYLLAKYEDRFTIHPRKYEELVASIFKGLGYRVRVTSYAKDDGIDIFVLDGQENDTVGIQVKRYRNKIEAEQIRAFAGALLLGGLTRGIYITTGKYRSGAEDTAKRYQRQGLAISLWDAKRFYDRMQIVKRPEYDLYDDPTAPYFEYTSDRNKIPRCWTRAW